MIPVRRHQEINGNNIDNNNNIIDFPEDNNNSASFKVKQQITRQTGNGGRNDVDIMVPLKHLSNF